MPKIDYKPDDPATVEVAVGPGTVIVNYISLVGVGQWGHLSFTPEQADVFIEALQAARKVAAKQRN